MASLQILRYSSSPFSISLPNSYRKSCWFCSEFNSQPRNRKFLSFQIQRSSRIFVYRSFRISSKLQEGDNQTNGEEPPESLFMKELRKRGMNPTSLLEESKKGVYADDETKLKEEGGYSKRNALTTDYEKSLSDQRERSMALNSEGLEYLGPSFVHGASKTPITPPQYIDPYTLLEEERITRPVPRIF
ncbi:uncharacterized protein LOC130754681 isoform X2 [Actinidia eriantha]|uniref:uncharacterized protein LOC130754681 isoform X2 n=1 Tax=Actinidia eriantha TaxID=165200 RepID=UPI0025837CF5|nr:uncharacterized protein LOC130754681 isoform X2 [Actinidia eriantha]